MFKFCIILVTCVATVTCSETCEGEDAVRASSILQRSSNRSAGSVYSKSGLKTESIIEAALEQRRAEPRIKPLITTSEGQPSASTFDKTLAEKKKTLSGTANDEASVQADHPEASLAKPIFTVTGKAESFRSLIRRPTGPGQLLELHHWMTLSGVDMMSSHVISKDITNDSNSQIAYVCVMTATACCLCCIFARHGVVSCIAIVCNVLSLSTIPLLVQHVYVNCNFQYPKFVTATHAYVTFYVGLLCIVGRHMTGGRRIVFPNLYTWTYGVVPTGVAFALSLSFSNIGLLYTNVHFYEMLGASGFLVTAFVGWSLGTSFDRHLIHPLLGITAGAIILAFGSLHLSTFGAGMILSAVFLRAIKAQLQSRLMGNDLADMTILDPLELVVAQSIVIFVIMLAWSLASEGLAPWPQSQDPTTAVALVVAAANAATINISCLFVIKSVGPVAQQCFGQLKGILCCIGAVAAFHENITSQQILGYSVVLISVLWYNVTSTSLKAPSSEKTSGIASCVMKG